MLTALGYCACHRPATLAHPRRPPFRRLRAVPDGLRASHLPPFLTQGLTAWQQPVAGPHRVDASAFPRLRILFRPPLMVNRRTGGQACRSRLSLSIRMLLPIRRRTRLAWVCRRRRLHRHGPLDENRQPRAQLMRRGGGGHGTPIVAVTMVDKAPSWAWR